MSDFRRMLKSMYICHSKIRKTSMALGLMKPQMLLLSATCALIMNASSSFSMIPVPALRANVNARLPNRVCPVMMKIDYGVPYDPKNRPNAAPQVPDTDKIPETLDSPIHTKTLYSSVFMLKVCLDARSQGAPVAKVQLYDSPREKLQYSSSAYDPKNRN